MKLNIISQTHLWKPKVLNTLFALSLGTYYVATHPPLMFRLAFHLSLPHLILQHIEHNILQPQQNYKPPQHNGPQSVSISETNNSVRYAITTTEELMVLSAVMKGSFSKPRVHPQTTSQIKPKSLILTNTSNLELLRADTPIKPQSINMIESDEIHSHHTPAIKGVMGITPIEEPLIEYIVPCAQNQIMKEPDIIQDPLLENQGEPWPDLPHQQKLIKIETPVIDKPTEVKIPILKKWNEYMLQSNNPLLRQWMMILAPGRKFSNDETLVRKALIETLLSSKYQSYIGLDWEESDEEEMRQRRHQFFQDYLNNVSWAETSFRQLYRYNIVNPYNFIEDAYDLAYELPIRLGIRLVKVTDFPGHESDGGI